MAATTKTVHRKNYEEIRKDQKTTREYHNEKHNQKVSHQPEQQPQPGDIVAVKQKQQKHVARDSYLVTENLGNKSKIHKVIHQHSSELANVRSKTYITDNKRLHIIKTNTLPSITKPPPVNIKKNTWNPINMESSDPVIY